MRRTKTTMFFLERRSEWKLRRALIIGCITKNPPSWLVPFSSSSTTHDSPSPELRSTNKKIMHLVRSGQINDAKALFDGLRERNTVTWNSMITGYVRNKDMNKARILFDKMPVKDVVSWNLMISGYVSCHGGRYMEEGRYLFDQMPERDLVSWNTMITGYARNGRMGDALHLFMSMPKRNVVSWNAMISGFLHNGDVGSAIEYFEKMPERDEASISALVSGLIQNGELDKAASVLLECEKSSDGRGDLLHAYNTLIAGYSHNGSIDDARRLFDQIPLSTDGREGSKKRFEKNLISWNTMIMGYVKAGDIFSARHLFNQMVERDTFSWNTMINGYVSISDLEEASNLFRQMPDPHILSWNSMISGFAQMGLLERAYDIFQHMPQRNVISWNSLLAGYEKNGDYEGAIKLFAKMQCDGEKPDRHTLSSLLSVCAESAALQLGMQIHQQVTKLVIPDVPLNNSLVTMYARCGAILEAETVFDEMRLQRDVISWNAMIGGYASHGYAEKALDHFAKMKRLKVVPTYITFISVLSACAHAGLADEARMHFRSMVSEFGIEPRVEHFASLVDVIGRQGQVEEAMELINSMPVEPDEAVWGALLSACKVHNNVELARVAAEALMKLQPESSAPYVLLYNMYADAGRWDEAAEVRMILERNNIRKERGYSMVNSSS